jgi:hypothetical protein
MPLLAQRFYPVLIVVACSLASVKQTSADQPVDFNRDIRPLLSSNCLTCHGPDEEERAAGLRLDTEAGSREDLGGYAAIVVGDSSASELVERLTTDDEDLRMPPAGKGRRFNDEEVALIRRWIDQGANYAEHWSYVKPQRPPLPAVTNTQWPIQSIDHFILARLEAEGLTPSPPADRLTLARRVSLDLTGLPPTWEQATKFANDPSVDAYEKYVDHLLDQPTFGERWAGVWLDLARYADSAGYADDPPRTIWAYRDYVIRSLNQNKPFDQFTIEQIAGDLIDDPTDEQLIATAFHRNTTTNNEGGTNDEEFRNVAIVDRVNTTMAVWMGTTMACAQCHTHKYDPITQAEYFQFFDFFNQSEDADKRDERPLLEIWSDDQRQRQHTLKQQIADLQKTLDHSTPELETAQAEWFAQLNTPATWHPVAPLTATQHEQVLVVDDQGWITTQAIVLGNTQDAADVLVTADAGDVFAGLRVEVTSDSTLALDAKEVEATWRPIGQSGLRARYVRVELPGNDKMIHLAELQVFSAGVNVALGATASQSSTGFGGNVQYAIDGNTNGDYPAGSVTHTNVEKDPWLELDLGSMQVIDSLSIWNRTDGGDSISQRLAGFQISLLDAERNVLWQQTPDEVPKPQSTFSISGDVLLKLVAIESGANALTLAAQPVRQLSDGELAIRIQGATAKAARLRLSRTSHESISLWASVPPEIAAIVRQPAAEVSPDQQKQLTKHYRSISPLLDPTRTQLAKLQAELTALKADTSVPVMRDLPESKHRTTNVQLRGSYLSKGEVVSAGVPAAFHPLPISDDAKKDRMALARWLVDNDNPLTARVVANRHWEQIFGIGLVETSEEFGSQGELPSHPELLDYLAVELHQSGWDLKQLLKLLVTSATYRQSSATTAELVQVDPTNRLLGRGPRFRASAEVVRDQALFVSGLLSDKMYGPPVQPMQPDLGLRAAFGSATDWTTSGGEDRYRRGLYTMWRRSSPYPSMAQFDSPNREVCTLRRTRTNTPLQALVTLNDPVYIEAAQALARRIVRASDEDASGIRFAFQQTLLREPHEAETQRLLKLLDELRAYYGAHGEEATPMATNPLGPIPADLSSHVTTESLAAWTVISNVILNLDETLMKR